MILFLYLTIDFAFFRIHIFHSQLFSKYIMFMRRFFMENSQRKYWNKILDTQNLREQRVLTDAQIEKEIQFYLSPEQQYAYSLMGDVKGKKILEIGGGLGINAIYLARCGAEVFVIDIAEERLNVLKKLIERLKLQDSIHLYQMQGELLAFKDNFFDIIYTKAVLIHTDVELVAKEVQRVLKNNGKGIFTEPFSKNPFANLYRLTFAPKVWRLITHYFDEQQVSFLIRQFQYFTIKKFYFLSFFAFFWQFGIQNKSLFQLSIKILTYIDDILFKIYPSLRQYAWFGVICIKK